MTQLMKKINPSKYKVFNHNFGGRNRLLVIFWK